MVNGLEVVALCGNAEDIFTFTEVKQDLARKGKLVVSPEHFDSDELIRHAKAISDIQRARIDLADGLYVINTSNPISPAMETEIAYAILTNKWIRLHIRDLITIKHVREIIAEISRLIMKSRVNDDTDLDALLLERYGIMMPDGYRLSYITKLLADRMCKIAVNIGKGVLI